MIDWVMWLPEIYEQKLEESLEQLETEKKMQYVTSWERRGIRKGREEGIREGIQKGILRGKTAFLSRMLVRRFGELPAWAEERLDKAAAADLERWSDRILGAGCLADVFAEDPKPES